MNNTKTMKTMLFASLIAAMILPFSGMNFVQAEKAPDFTDYVSQYAEVDKKIRENVKSIGNDKKQLKDNSNLSSLDVETIEKRIKDKEEANVDLWKELDRIQQLSIESYILDEKTQAIYDNDLEKLTNNFLDEYGIYDISPSTKYRKMLVFVDPSIFEDSSFNGDRNALANELKKTTKINVEIIFEKLTLTHSTSCTDENSACHNPGKGGISVSHQSSTGVGNTLGFKALHPTFGSGFVITEHEVPNGTEQVVQPLSTGGVIGQAKVAPSGTCDCAFIQFTGGHYMNDEIWAPDFGTIYPVETRNIAATPAGTIVAIDGVGGVGFYGAVDYENDHSGKFAGTASPGDSGSAVFKPLVNGNADIYGIAKGTTGGYTFYEPYDHIKDQLGLTW